jgi:hypothetical protein
MTDAEAAIRDYIRHHADILDTIEALAKFANAMPQPTENGTRLDVSAYGRHSVGYVAERCRTIRFILNDIGPIK